MPSGWSVNDLLNQPGMSLAQANDLVAQITGGQKGVLAPGTTTQRPVRPNPFTVGNPTVATTSPYDNPFMPKQGELGASATSDPSSIAGRAGWNITPFTPGPASPAVAALAGKNFEPPKGNVTPKSFAPPVNVTPKAGNATPQDITAYAAGQKKLVEPKAGNTTPRF
jgi:hypothetical protein